MSRRILKWQLPVDDEWHRLPGPFDHCEVDVYDPGIMWLWSVEMPHTVMWDMRVFGTGHDLPDVGNWVGTARHDGTGLVWHVLARPIPDEMHSEHEATPDELSFVERTGPDEA